MQWFRVVSVVFGCGFLTFACGDSDGGGSTETDSTGTETDVSTSLTTMGTMGTATTATTMGTMGTATTMATTMTTDPDTGSSDSGSDSGSGTTGTGDSGSSSSSGGGGGGTYAPCPNGDECDEGLVCNENIGNCSIDCEGNDENCPDPPSGNAMPVCSTVSDTCVLPCDDATTCPDGMTCQSFGGGAVELCAF